MWQTMSQYYIVTHNITFLHTILYFYTECHIVTHNVTLLHTMSQFCTQYHSVTHNVTHSFKIVLTILRTMIIYFTQRMELGNIRIDCYL